MNVHEAKTYFSKLLGRVKEGEEVVITKAGKKQAEEDFPNDPALAQVHAARKILAREAELTGLSCLKTSKKLEKLVRQKTSRSI